jgi:hypothetical protein
MPKRINATFLFLVLATMAVVTVNSASKPLPTGAGSVFLSTGEAVGESSLAQSFTYRGKHSEWVSKLLTRAGGWKCPANASDRGAPPTVKAEECMRDKYVAAAVLYAWAAECYARNEEDAKAADAAERMYEQLKSTQGLCSDAPSIGPSRECDTERIYDCGEL